MTRTRSFVDDSGATAIEYALMVAAIAAIIVLVISLLGRQTVDQLCMASSAMENVVTTTNPNC